MTKVVVLDDYQGRASGFADWAALGGDVAVTFVREPVRGDALVAALADADAVVLMRERTALPRETLEALGRLRVVVTTGMNNASVDSAYLAERGIAFCGTDLLLATVPGTHLTAETAWALILALTKRVVSEDAALRAGRWQLDYPRTLAGMTLGLAGLGKTGAAMVAPARAFGMEVIAWSQNLTAARAAEVGAELVSKDELLDRCDVLSIHLVLSARTRGLFGRPELARLRRTAFVVNTSRGPILDEDALVEALRSRAIAGGGLDVFNVEPLPANHPLLSLDNVVVLPHIGYLSEENMAFMYGQAVEDLAAFFAGAPIRQLEPRTG